MTSMEKPQPVGSAGARCESAGGRVHEDSTRAVPHAATTNRADIERFIELLMRPGDVLEVRAPKTKRGVVSGVYDDARSLVRDALKWSGQAEGVYVTLNPIRPDLLARSYNRAQGYSRHTTADADILERRWLLVDFDPKRPAGVSATDEEHQDALDRAQSCRDWLTSQGAPEPVYADSGNGAHLLYALALPNSPEVVAVLRDCLLTLAARFDDEHVTIDPTTFNASRISKIYGTLAAKGDQVPKLGRVHRMARLLDLPERVKPLTLVGGSS